MLCSLDQESRRSSVGLSSSTKHAADRKESESKKERYLYAPPSEK